MDIAWFRDLVIIIEGIVATLLLILLGVIAWIIFQRFKEIANSAKQLSISAQSVVDSLKVSADNVASVSSFARQELAEPMIKIAAIVQGVTAGLNSIMGFFHRKKGGDRCE